MNHPNSEDWMSYLYDELPPERRRELDAHAASCADCRTQLTSWRGAMTELDRWAIPTPRRAAQPFGNYARWAAAAVALIGLGFGLAQLTTLRSTLAGVETRLRDQLHAEFAQLSQGQATQNAQYHDALVNVLGNLEAQRRADYARLRRDVETVAVLAEDGLSSTQEQLVQLANTPPSLSPKRN
ncbi:MAG TPA: zf-HC2 domain-containing protein [Verrucomicrobiae bacterium]|jgi:hypothetical protein